MMVFVLVEDVQPAVQVGHRDVVALDGGRGRHAEAGHDFLDELAVEAVVQQAAPWCWSSGCGRRSSSRGGS